MTDTSDAPISSSEFAQLDALSTEELRHQAFELAEHRRDVRFFWDVVKHLPESGALASEDGSLGNITGSLVETVQLVRDLFGGHMDNLGEAEPLLRAKFIDYLGSAASATGSAPEPAAG